MSILPRRLRRQEKPTKERRKRWKLYAEGQTHRGPTGQGTPDAAVVHPATGHGRRLMASPSASATGVDYAPAPSPSGAYQPPPAGELTAAGITNALPGTLSFCDE